jgi:hypothetical protein
VLEKIAALTAIDMMLLAFNHTPDDYQRVTRAVT